MATALTAKQNLFTCIPSHINTTTPWGPPAKSVEKKVT
ncbi:uncharacterized protein G2W53_019207 [Senna tora]|uniref:Uncharacterized protein n=1 Tax=Senna tora TaxID=362788 RepID=A0A834TT74_9FABA|nr:uncharacterized protein G2W53_019207 [Senna tora]